MRILFTNHTSAWSGAEVSLMRVLEGLRHEHDLTVACPAGGKLTEAVEGIGVRCVEIPSVDVSLRPHPVHTPAGLARMRSAGVQLARAARSCRAEVIHANTPRAGLVCAVARRHGAPPVVVRAHEHLPLNPVGRAARAAIVRSAASVAAVSDFTAQGFNEGLPRPVAVRVYNSIDHGRFDRSRVRPAGLRRRLGLPHRALLLGEVAQITPWKGQDTAIVALSLLRADGLDAHLVLVGSVVFGGKSVRHDNNTYLERLHGLAGELGVSDAVHFLGQRADVPEIVRDLDLSLLPSWHEPFGLATVESLALGTPVLVGSVGAGPELVTDGVDGRVLPPRQPDVWAAAARELLVDPVARRWMGAHGPGNAARFTDDVHAHEMLTLYRAAAEAQPRRRRYLARRTAKPTVAHPA
jgi:glycosyltransferase involved in cell wall biosynthesis